MQIGGGILPLVSVRTRHLFIQSLDWNQFYACTLLVRNHQEHRDSWTEISFMRVRSCKVSVSETQFRLPFPDRLSVCCCKLLFDKVFLSLFLRWFSSVYERCLYSHLFTEVSVCLTRVAVVPACLLHFNHKHPLMCPLIGSRRPWGQIFKRCWLRETGIIR